LLGLAILVTRAHNKDHQFGVGFYPSPFFPPSVARSGKQASVSSQVGEDTEIDYDTNAG